MRDASDRETGLGAESDAMTNRARWVKKQWDFDIALVANSLWYAYHRGATTREGRGEVLFAKTYQGIVLFKTLADSVVE